MKYAIALFWTMLLAVTAEAQISKGRIMLGTSVGISNNAPYSLYGAVADNHAGIEILNTTYKAGGLKEHDNATLVSLSPGIGFFVDNYALLGLNTSFSYLNRDDENPALFSVITPLIRFYLNSNSNVKPFIEARAGIALLATKHQFPQKDLLVGGRAGAAFFLNDAVSLDLFMDYNYSQPAVKNKVHNDITNSAFGLGLGFSFFL